MKLPVVSVVVFGSLSALAAGGAEIDNTIIHALEFSATRAEALATTVLGAPTVYTDYSNTAGTWLLRSRSTWTSGFVPGIFWQLYEETGDDAWRTRAEMWTEGVRLRATEPDNDTGFQIFCSFGRGYEATGRTNADYLAVMTTAAATFDAQRFNPTIGCYRSWRNTSANPVTNPSTTDGTTNPSDPIFEVNIDEMMNLELPLYVGTHGGNAALVDHAIAHADRSWEVLVRPDGSTVHVAGFNTDGTVQYLRSAQGWIPESTWSRGQAWAVYGYTMVYRYTGLQRMLDRADACFDYFRAAVAAQSNDAVPYSDFDAPLDSNNPRDTSAAAIVASAAMELYDITGETKYRDAVTEILLALGSSTYLAEGTRYQSILRRGSSRWGTAEVATIFGDYYFLEAMRRYEATFGLTPGPDPALETGHVINISTRGLVGSGNEILIGGFIVTGSPMTVLLRGVGPGLVAHGVPDPASDPAIQLFSQANSSTPLAQNDDWGDAPNAAEIETTTTAISAFPLDEGSTDAALLLTLEPGAYTVHLSNQTADETKVGLVEVYAVP